jgi:lysyl oxidase
MLVAGIAALVISATAGQPASERLPDLDQVVPHKLRVRERDGRFLLGFASAVDNVGRRALVVEGRRTRGETMMRIWQLVGGRRRRVDGALRYVVSPDHAHWHLLDFERYELRRPDGRPVRRVAKTGFCLTDSFDAGPVTLPGEPRHARWVNECGRRRPSLARLRQGISVGFRDVYEPFLEGQSVDLTRLPAGRYLLVHRANPTRALLESDYGNNAASVVLRVRWPHDFEQRPAVRVLARCPDAASCP